MLLVTRLLASSELAWGPMASSSVNSCRKRALCPSMTDCRACALSFLPSAFWSLDCLIAPAIASPSPLDFRIDSRRRVPEPSLAARLSIAIVLAMYAFSPFSAVGDRVHGQWLRRALAMYAFSVWTEFRVSTGKRVSTREACHWITRMTALQEEQTREPHYLPPESATSCS
jgi:hypothetical protein